MFEGLIEQLILAYLGDYIENLDKDKLSLGVSTHISQQCIYIHTYIYITHSILIDMVR